MKTFEGILRQGDDGGCFVELPFDARSAFGKVRAPVVATANGHQFRTTLMRYGGADYVGLNRSVRDAAHVAPDDQIRVTLELDHRPRTVEEPPELAAALAAEPDAQRAFETLSPTHRREYAQWVAEGKRERLESGGLRVRSRWSATASATPDAARRTHMSAARVAQPNRGWPTGTPDSGS